MAKIAVVGAGLYGCSAAFMLARAGHNVTIYDRSLEIMGGASAINQGRLHKGYHYPRSPETIEECLTTQDSFKAEFSNTFLKNTLTTYAIAKDSKTSPSQFEAVCKEFDLPVAATDVEYAGLSKEHIEAAYQAHEYKIDLTALRRECINKLYAAKVKIELYTPFEPDYADDFDFVVLAAYSNNNHLLYGLNLPMGVYRFELVEKIMVQVPEKHSNLSVVVLDGEYCSIDPSWCSPFLYVGHVKHAVHHAHEGYFSDMPYYFPLNRLNRYYSRMEDHTRFNEMMEAAAQLVPAMAQADYVGSAYTIRAVEAGVDDTDRRLSAIKQHSAKVFSIFSGKLGSAVTTAKKLTAILSKKDAVLE